MFSVDVSLCSFWLSLSFSLSLSIYIYISFCLSLYVYIYISIIDLSRSVVLDLLSYKSGEPRVCPASQALALVHVGA